MCDQRFILYDSMSMFLAQFWFKFPSKMPPISQKYDAEFRGITYRSHNMFQQLWKITSFHEVNNQIGRKYSESGFYLIITNILS